MTFRGDAREGNVGADTWLGGPASAGGAAVGGPGALEGGSGRWDPRALAVGDRSSKGSGRRGGIHRTSLGSWEAVLREMGAGVTCLRPEGCGVTVLPSRLRKGAGALGPCVWGAGWAWVRRPPAGHHVAEMEPPHGM